MLRVQPTCCGAIKDLETKSHWIVRLVVVASVEANSHWSRTLPPAVTLTYFCGVVTVISSTHPANQESVHKIYTCHEKKCNHNNSEKCAHL